MLDFLKGKRKGNCIGSPCKGKAVALTEVPDPTFSEKILGDGFAVIPSEGKIYAPADGEVTVVFDTLHAITMTTDQGAELLIHIGLDTVTLKGAPFTAHVAAGDHVKKGDLLLDADLEKIQEAGLHIITPRERYLPARTCSRSLKSGTSVSTNETDRNCSGLV